ncbi:MAG: hypothetical protein Q8Q39_01075 [bacterium]|nr:hypothetical protein [bacterium]
MDNNEQMPRADYERDSGGEIMHEERMDDPKVKSLDYVVREEDHNGQKTVAYRAVRGSAEMRTPQESQKMEMKLAIKAGEERAALRKKKEEEVNKKDNVIEFPKAA